MKRSYKIMFPLFILLILGCSTNKSVVLPEGMVPKRKNLNQDVYGGYIRLLTITEEPIHGEFIGMHQDSLVIWENKIRLLHPDQINQAQLYIFDYNTYGGALLLSIVPNVALLAHIPQYGFGPLLIAALFSGLNLIGAGAAEYT
jgi:hypothetical protein